MTNWLIPIVVIVIAIAGYISIQALTQTSQVQNSATTSNLTACNQALWQHVYNPSRLNIKNNCIAVTGIINGTSVEADGDYHIDLTLDPQYTYLLTNGSYNRQHGDLVLEPICQHQVTQQDAQASCAGFTYQVNSYPIGTHVQVIGSYVWDSAHYNWAEIHPVSSIQQIT